MSNFNEEICVEKEDFKESENLASVTIIRSNTIKLDSGKGKIVKYRVDVKVRDSKDFNVELSRDDAERIFGLYTYYGGNITARNVANEFPRFTLSEIKKIFRAFKLTKDSAWFPPHMLEEMNEEQLDNYRMSLKERAAFKYADSRQERDLKNSLNKMASEINSLKDYRDFFESMTRELMENPIKFNRPPLKITKADNKKTLMLFLADMHIGAKVEYGSLYQNPYDLNEIYNRLDTIVQYLSNLGRFYKIVVVNGGDAIDGIDNQTARRDHYMPQSMGNKEQINNFAYAIIYLFQKLIELDLAENYSFQSVVNGNHDGDTGWITSKYVATVLKVQYPNIETNVADSFFLRYDVDDFSYIICHGKDSKYMKKGMPMVMDSKTEVFLTQYINSQNDLRKYINVVSGDLHNESMTRGKLFKYWKVGSFFGSSDYCMYNFGDTAPHVNYHIIEGSVLLNGTIELRK